MAVFGRDEGAGRAGLEKHVALHRVRYPVLHDAAGRNAKALGIKGYPAAVLLDARGRVVWEGPFFAERLADLERRIRDEIRRKQVESRPASGPASRAGAGR